MTKEEYYKPCSTCHNDECVWKGTKDTHLICEDYKSIDGDCISRQAVLELAEWFDLNLQHFSVANLIDEVENMPSVQPKSQIDKLKAEIIEMKSYIVGEPNDYDDGFVDALNMVLETIEESEGMI